VACGGRHTLVLGATGEVWSCGCNTHGQLGHGERFGLEPLQKLVAVVLLSDERIVQLAAGGAHSAGLSTNGELYTWGKNHNGQLGLGHARAAFVPERLAVLGGRVAWVACGGAHTACLTRVGETEVDEGSADADTTQRSLGSTVMGSGRSAAASGRVP